MIDHGRTDPESDAELRWQDDGGRSESKKRIEVALAAAVASRNALFSAAAQVRKKAAADPARETMK
jgi:hypothetical protein